MQWNGIVCLSGCCSFINRETSGVVSASYLSMREIFSTSGTLLIYLIITIFYLFLVVRPAPPHTPSRLLSPSVPSQARVGERDAPSSLRFVRSEFSCR